MVTLSAQAQITGSVFQDFNANGLRDTGEPGQPGVSITVFGSAGTQVGAASTDGNGFYSLTPSGPAPFRVQFTNIGAGYTEGVAGPGGSTSVQFVYTTSAVANLGLYKASDSFCQPNPQIAVPCYVNGDPLKNIGTPGSASVQDALVSVAYDGQGRSPAVAHYANTGAVGAVWGLAYQKETKKLFSAAFIKRHTGLGPLGTGGIYVTDITTGTTANFFKLDDFPGVSTGPDPHSGLPANTTTPNYDAAAYTQVGKVGLGDIELSEDGTVLYVVNLFDRRLYAFPVGNPAVKPTTFTAYDIPQPNGPDSRPFALHVYQGNVYVGVTGTAESEYATTVKASPAVVSPNLRGYVYAINPKAAAPAFTKVLDFPFTYTKGISILNNPNTNQWFPWVPAYSKANNDPPFLFESEFTGGSTVKMYPQPWLTAIEIIGDGSMVLGIRNREGDQIGQYNYLPDPNGQDTTLVRTHGVGDILKAGKCAPGVNQWTIESNAAICGGLATAGKDNNQGPGGGEFYYQDNSIDHQETSNGSLAFLPGSNEIVNTLTDPLEIYSGGLARFNNTTGQRITAVQIFQSSDKNPTTFGKSAGLGDMELLLACGSAPIEIGNRIWADQNGDGIQGANEPGLDGVRLDLYQGMLKVGTTLSNLSGGYYFSSDNTPGGLTANTAYQIRIEPTQTRLAAFGLTLFRQGSNPLLDSDASIAGGNWVIDLTTGGNSESNYSYDIGVACATQATASIAVDLCLTGTISLSATGGETYAWTGPNGFTSTLANPVINRATAATLGRYSVTVKTMSPFGTNTVLNSDLAAGNTGFSSDYVYTGGNPLVTPGQYNVVQLPYTAPGTTLGDPNTLPAGLTDHSSGTASGYVQLVSGSTTAGQRVWYQTLPVVLNTRYRFSFAAANTTQNATQPKPHIAATINGQSIIADRQLTNLFEWNQLDYVWDSGSNTMATFAIINPAVNNTGNRFALDDVAIIALDACSATASVMATDSSAASCTPITIQRSRVSR